MRLFICLAALVAFTAAVPAHHTLGTYVKGPIDTDGDGIPDNCDPDDDGDGIADPDKGDLCFQLKDTKSHVNHPAPVLAKSHDAPVYAPKSHDHVNHPAPAKSYDPYYDPKVYGPIDTDGDGIPDNCDPDDDGDGVADPDKGDLCFALANPHPKSHHQKTYQPKSHHQKSHLPADYYDPKKSSHHDPYYHPKKTVWNHVINGYHTNHGATKGGAVAFKYGGVNNYQPWRSYHYYY